MYFSISDFEIGGAYFLKGMTSRPPLKVLKVSSDCLLFFFEALLIIFANSKKLRPKTFQKNTIFSSILNFEPF